MNENFIVFANDNLGKLNAAIRDDGSVWFLAKDIAEILEMQAKNALRMLEDSDRVEIYADLGNGRRKYQLGADQRYFPGGFNLSNTFFCPCISTSFSYVLLRLKVYLANTTAAPQGHCL